MSERGSCMQFDLHGHTKAGFWPDRLPYDVNQALIKAKSLGLDGVAITEHDTMKSLDRALDMGAKLGIIVVPGVEITSWEFRRFPHILALGITPEMLGKDKIPMLKSPETVLSWIRDHNGIAVAVHPNPHKGITALSYDEIIHYQQLFNGIETVTTFGVNNEAVELAENLDLAQLGSSDFHVLEQIGLVATEVFQHCDNWQDVIKAIREKNVRGFVRTDIPKSLVGRRSNNLLWNFFIKRKA